MNIEEYFDFFQISTLRKLLNAFSYVNPIWKQIFLDNQTYMEMEIRADVSGSPLFNGVLQLIHGDLEELNRILTLALNYLDDLEEGKHECITLYFNDLKMFEVETEE